MMAETIPPCAEAALVLQSGKFAGALVCDVASDDLRTEYRNPQCADRPLIRTEQYRRRAVNRRRKLLLLRPTERAT